MVSKNIESYIVIQTLKKRKNHNRFIKFINKFYL